MRNAFVVVMAMGGSTNVVLHGPEIARAAGFDLWKDVLSQQEFNALSHRLPVLVNTSLNTDGRPMVDDPRDALECFGSAPIDLLSIGGSIVRRHG